MNTMTTRFLTAGIVFSAFRAGAAESNSERDQLLQQMKDRAKQITVTVVERDKSQELALHERPLIRYNDQQRRIVDASMWTWGRRNRPEAVCKIEVYSRDRRRWLFCFASLSQNVVSANWASGTRWSATQPGLEFKRLKDVPSARDSKVVRIQQIRQLARRFKCTFYDDPAGTQEEVRLLPTPLKRYDDKDQQILDAAFFGFGNYGTNPAVILFIELHGRNIHNSVWKYGFAGLTQGRLSASFDDKEVWTKPWTNSRGAQDTWIWFYDRSQP